MQKKNSTNLEQKKMFAPILKKINFHTFQQILKKNRYKNICQHFFPEFFFISFPYRLQTPSNFWPGHSLHDTNVTSLPVSLTTHHAVWSWQGGNICIVYGVPGSKVARCLHALRRSQDIYRNFWPELRSQSFYFFS